MNCIVCKTELKNVFEQENQPIDGLAFTTSGHYGSTVFDPMDGTYLVVNVCDECLKAAGADGRVKMGFPQPSPPPSPLFNWPMEPVESES